MPNKRSLGLDKIIAQATEMVRTQGLNQTTLPNLAKTLNVRSQSLYHYLDNRSQLLSLVAASRINILHDKLVEELMGLSGNKAIFRFADVTRNFILHDEALIQILYHLNDYKNNSAINQAIKRIIALGDKLNLRKASFVSTHALIGAVLGYVFFDRSVSFAQEDEEEANRNYHEMILRLVDPAASLQQS